jgi:hypothetical protein
MSPEQADKLMQQSDDKTEKNLQQGELREYWEQRSDQPLQEMLYGDGLDGWTTNPAR